MKRKFGRYYEENRRRETHVRRPNEGDGDRPPQPIAREGAPRRRDDAIPRQQWCSVPIETHGFRHLSIFHSGVERFTKPDRPRSSETANRQTPVENWFARIATIAFSICGPPPREEELAPQQTSRNAGRRMNQLRKHIEKLSSVPKIVQSKKRSQDCDATIRALPDLECSLKQAIENLTKNNLPDFDEHLQNHEPFKNSLENLDLATLIKQIGIARRPATAPLLAVLKIPE